MAKYKISELAQLWGCSVPTVHKRVEKEGYKTIQALDEQNKMVKYVIIDDVENDVNNVNNDDVIDVEPVVQNVENVQNNKFIEALMTLTRDHEKKLETITNQLIDYKSKALLLEDKKYSEGMLIDRNKELQEENRGLKREKKDLQKVNDYFKYALFASIIVIVGLLIYHLPH